MKKLLPLGIALLGLLGNTAFAATASWSGTGDGTSWSQGGAGGNWSGAAAPGATTGTTSSDTATFATATTGTAVTIDSGRNIQNITFDTLAGPFTIGSAGANAGNSLLLSLNGTLQIASTFTGTGITETINAPLTAEGNAYTFSNNVANSSDVLSFAGNITNAVASSINLAGANTGNNIISGVISNGVGTESLTKAGAGTWILSGADTYTGGTRINAGTLEITNSLNGTTGTALTLGGAGNSGIAIFNEAAGSSQGMGALGFVGAGGEGTVESIYGGSGTTTLTFSSFASRGSTAATGNFIVSGGVNGSTNKIVLTGVTANTFIGTDVFFNGSNYAWNDAAGYVRGINYGVDTNSESIASSQAAFTAGKQYEQVTGSGAITGQTTQIITSLNLNNSTNFILASGATLTTSGILKSGNTAGGTISGGTGIQGASGAELVIRTDLAGDTLNINTPVLANGASSLTKSGAGTLTLSGNNTYTGVTNVDGGTLILSGNNSGASAGLTAQTGATAILSGNNTYTTGSFTEGIGGTLVLSGDNTGTSGTFAVSLSGSGTLDLNNAKALGNTTALTITNGGGILDNTSGGAITISTGNTINAGSFVFAGTNDLNLGTGTYNVSSHSTITTLAGTLTIGGNLPGTVTNFILKAGAGTLAIAGNITYLGQTGIGSNNGINAGTLILSGDNSAATGGVGINNGTLDIDSSTALGGALVILSSSATLDNTSSGNLTETNNPAQTWSTGFTFTGTHDLNMGTGAITMSGAPTITVANGTLTEGGAIATTTNGLTKAGAGTLVLAGANNYTGTTLINAGVLNLTGSSKSATTTVTNSTFEGTGSTTGVVNVGNGTNAAGTAFLAPGTMGTIGMLSTGAVTIKADGVLSIDLNSSLNHADLLNVTGLLTLNSGAELQLTDLGSATLSSGTVFDIASYTTLSGTFAGLANGSDITVGSNIFQINYGTTPNEITLTDIAAVPEPSTWALLFSGCALLVVLQRRRNSRA